MENIKEKFIKGSIGQYLFIITQTVVGICKAPIGINYFGSDVYGIWLVISSIISYLSLSQMGIGPTLITLLSQSEGNNRQKAIIINSIKILSIVSIGIIIILFILNFLFSDWIKLFFNIKGTTKYNEVALYTTSLMVLFTAIRLPFIVFKSSFSGFQEVFWNKIYSTLGSAFSLIALILTVFLKKNLIYLAMFTGSFYIIIGILSGVHLIKKYPSVFRSNLKYENDYFSRKELLKTGFKFFILSITSTVILQTDNIIISSIKGPGFVTSYALTFKIYFIMLNFINALTVGLWPVYGSLFKNEKWEKIDSLYNQIATIVISLGGLAWIGGLNFTKLVIDMWVGPKGYAGFLTSFSLGGFVLVSSFVGGVNTPLINGSNPDKKVLIISILEGAGNLALSLLLIKYFGVAGVAIATFIVRVLFRSWFGPFYIKYKTKNNVKLNLKIILKNVFLIIAFVILSIINQMFNSNEIISYLFGILLVLIYSVLNIRYLLKYNAYFKQICYSMKNKLLHLAR